MDVEVYSRWKQEGHWSTLTRLYAKQANNRTCHSNAQLNTHTTSTHSPRMSPRGKVGLARVASRLASAIQVEPGATPAAET